MSEITRKQCAIEIMRRYEQIYSNLFKLTLIPGVLALLFALYLAKVTSSAVAALILLTTLISIGNVLLLLLQMKKDHSKLVKKYFENKTVEGGVLGTTNP